MTTIYTAIAVFSITAILGMFLFSQLMNDKPLTKTAALFHGLFALTGLVLLLLYINCNAAGPITSITVFAIAAFGGLVMLVKDLNGKPVPKWLAVVHGLAAILGFILLVAFAFGSDKPM